MRVITIKSFSWEQANSQQVWVHTCILCVYQGCFLITITVSYIFYLLLQLHISILEFNWEWYAHHWIEVFHLQTKQNKKTKKENSCAHLTGINNILSESHRVHPTSAVSSQQINCQTLSLPQHQKKHREMHMPRYYPSSVPFQGYHSCKKCSLHTRATKTWSRINLRS